jgi:hypothetical protein
MSDHFTLSHPNCEERTTAIRCQHTHHIVITDTHRVDCSTVELSR